MGATFLTMEIRGQSERTLNSQFKKRVANDRACYGSDPYSGSWAGVDRVILINYPKAPKAWTKKSRRAAFDYLCEECEKWEAAKAIKTKTGFLVAAWVAT